MSLQCGTVQIPIRHTRFRGLGFVQLDRRVWRFLDLDSKQVIGLIYASRAELLADLRTVADVYGYEA